MSSPLQKPNLIELRSLIGSIQGHGAREVFSCSPVPAGIPRGALTEIAGPLGRGKTEFVLRFLAEHPEARVAWIEHRFSAYPYAFPQRDVSLNRVLFAEAGHEILWTVLQILRSQLFPIVVCDSVFDEKELRKIQLASEKAKTSVLLLSEKNSAAWPIALQLEIHPEGHIHIRRKRG